MTQDLRAVTSGDLPEGPSMLFPYFHSLTQLYEFIQALAIEIRLIVKNWKTVLAYQPLYVKSENSFGIF